MMNRKEFLESSLGLATAVFGFAACSLAACGKDPSVGGDDDGNPMIDAGKKIDGGVDAPKQLDARIDGPPANCNMNGTAVAIGANHGHVMTVSKADIAAGVEKTYDITGAALHPHTVTLTASDFAKLANNQDVTVTSSTDGHSHAITVRCA